MKHLAAAAGVLMAVAFLGFASAQTAESKTSAALAELKTKTAAMLKGVAPLPKSPGAGAEAPGLDAPPVIWRVGRLWWSGPSATAWTPQRACTATLNQRPRRKPTRSQPNRSADVRSDRTLS